ncbi:MAG: hypothetical protein AAF725_08010 [Acidobacteriota bacterium]
MKTSRNLVLSILLTATLIIAPCSIAKPAEDFVFFDIVEFMQKVTDSLFEFFFSATGTTGDTGEGDGGSDEEDDEGEDVDPLGPGEDGATVVIDPNG